MIKIKNKLLMGLLLTAVVCGTSQAASIPSWAVNAGLKFINDPGDVFNDFHLDNTDFTPNNIDSHGSIRTNFLTSYIPFTWANLNAKVKILNDGKIIPWIPQVDFMGSYGRIVALDILPTLLDSGSSDEENSEDSSSDEFIPPTMTEYSAGIVLTKAVSKETRLFAGFNYSVMVLDLELPASVTEDLPAPFDSINSLNASTKDYILITGISNIVREDKRVMAYLGYGFKYKKIFSRFAWYHEHLELGFNIYPEGLLVVHPFLGWHWDF